MGIFFNSHSFTYTILETIANELWVIFLKSHCFTIYTVLETIANELWVFCLFTLFHIVLIWYKNIPPLVVFETVNKLNDEYLV